MSARGDDVSDLFKSFGAEKTQFRELARSSVVAAAETRWPLFKMIQAEEQAVVPPLSNLAKSRWQDEQGSAAAASKAPASVPGDMMALSLRQLNRAPAAQPERATAPAALPVARPVAAAPIVKNQPQQDTLRKSLAPAMFGRAVQEPQPSIQKPVVPGLFSKRPAVADQPSAGADDSLSSIFRRLDGQAPSAPAPRLSFLRQTERR